MSRSIDERVVKMEFDNKAFEQNVQQSVKSLENLNRALNLDNATKGFSNVQTAANNLSLDTIAAGVDAIANRFSAMGIVGMRVLENITDSVVNFAGKVTSFLTDSIVNGGISRAMNLTQARFQLQGLLKDEQAVEAVMENVNESVTGTAYRLDSAAMAASQFAASGMRAGDEMLSSLRAITGVAAMTNAEYEDISRVFTTVAGNGRLMGDQLLQLSSRGLNAAATLAEYMTKVGEGTVYTEAQIRDMVSKGEISFQTFSAAMDDAFGAHAKKANETFTGAMSNVKAALAKIGADFVTPLVEQNGPIVAFLNALRERVNDIKANIGPLADIFVGTAKRIADGATAYLQNLDLTGAFVAFYNTVDATGNVLQGLWSILDPIAQAFRDIFPKVTIDNVIAFTESVKEFTSTLRLSEPTANNLKNTFKGFFAVLSIGGQAISAVLQLLSPFVGVLARFGANVLGVTGSFGEWLAQLDVTIRETNMFGKAVDKITQFVNGARDALKAFWSAVQEKFSSFPGIEAFHSVLEKVQERLHLTGESFRGFLPLVIDVFKGLYNAVKNSKFLDGMQGLASGIGKVTGTIIETVGSFIKQVMESLENGDFSGLFDLFNSLSLGAIAIGIKKFFDTFTKTFKDANGFLKSVQGILDGVKGSLEAWQNDIKANTLLKIAGAIAILTASLVVLSSIDSGKLTASLGAITVLFAELMGSMAIFNKLSIGDGVGKAAITMLAISAAVLILAGAMKKMADLDWDGVAKGVVGIGAMAAVLVTSAKLLQSSSAKIITGSAGLLIFAGAVKILAGVASDLARLSWEELTKGMTGVVALLGAVSLFLNTAKFQSKAISTATGVVIIASAMKILASAAKDFASMNLEGIRKAIAGIGALLTEVALFTHATGNAKNVISSAASLVIIAASMKIFASATADFARLSWDGIAKGLVGMAGALTAVTVALRLMPKNMIGLGAGLLVVSAAMLVMANALTTIGGLSWEEVGKGMVVVAGSMTIFATALTLMKGTLGASASILVVVGALALLTPILSILGAMSWEAIAKGLISIAGAFAIFGIAGAVLGPMVTTLLALSAAVALFGVGIAATGGGLILIGAGLSAVAVGIGALAAAVAGGGTAIVAGVTVMVSTLAGLFPQVARSIGDAIIELARVVGEEAPQLAEAAKKLILALIDALVESVPALADGALAMLLGVVKALVDHTQELVEGVFNFVIAILQGVANKLPDLIQGVVDVVMAFFQGVVSAMQKIDPEILVKGILGVGLITAMMAALAAVALLAPAAMLGVVAFGGVITELAFVLAAVGKLAEIPGLEAAIGQSGGLLEKIGVAIGSFIGGIAGGAIKGATSTLPAVADSLSQFMQNLQPFIEGAGKINNGVLDGIQSLAGVILLLTGGAILDGLTSWLTGGSSLVDFGRELAEFGPYFNQYYESIKGMDAKVIEASGNAARALSEMAANLPNSGGVASWFAGENSLTIFAEELVAFGPKFMEYANSVKGLDGDVVMNSANAAKALSDMASNLPNSGGVAGWFAGENKLSDFARELATFGPSIMAYARSVSGMDTDVVTNTANAVKVISELATNLPNSGGVASWFAGDNTISSFGEQLSVFGTYFAQYANSVKGVDVAQLKGVTEVLAGLVDVASLIGAGDAGGLSGFAYSLQGLGLESVAAFASAFENSGSQMQTAGASMVDALIKAIKGKEKDLTATATKLAEACVKALLKDKASFTKAGVEVITLFNSGVASKSNDAANTFIEVITTAIAAIEAKYKAFYDAGAYLVTGFISGIKANIKKAAEASAAMAKAAADAAEAQLEEASPSKVGFRIGDFFGVAFVNAIAGYTDLAFKNAYDMASAAKNGMMMAVDNLTNMIETANPVITPVLDVDEVMRQSELLGGSFADTSFTQLGQLNALFKNNQNGSDSQLLSAIQKLTRNIENMPEGMTAYINGNASPVGTEIEQALFTLLRGVRTEGRT